MLFPPLLLCAGLAAAPPETLVIGLQLPADPARAEAQVRALLAASHGELRRALPFAVVIETRQPAAARRVLARRPEVRWIEPERVLRIVRRAVPDDPLYPVQWHLHPTQDPAVAAGVHLNLEPAWDLTRGLALDGRPVRVAVLDDGFDLGHPDLAPRFAATGCDLTAGADPTDCAPGSAPAAGPDTWHGTLTAGVVAATGFNGEGVAGVCPACQLLPVRLFTGADDSALFVTGSAIAAAVVWAVAQGADVINCSWGPPDGNPLDPLHPVTLQPPADGDRPAGQLPRVVDEAIRHAIVAGRGGLGAVITMSAGNGNELLGYDAFSRDPRVLTVGAVDASGRRAPYSDYGPGLFAVAPSSGGGDAPGIWSTDLQGEDGAGDGDYAEGYGGTSAAAAAVAGVAALVLAAYPELTAAQVHEALARGAARLSGEGLDDDAHAFRYGHGLIDAAAALAAAAGYRDRCTLELELCGNEVDDDCDGQVDEDPRCSPCVPDQPREICDGHDNNCDGRNNEGFVCDAQGRPACAPCASNAHCQPGLRCLASAAAADMRCLPSCGEGGPCPDGFACDGAVCQLVLSAETGSCDDYLVCRILETCDGQDNDCDGEVDDLAPEGREAAVERARCKAPGVCLARAATCVQGAWRCLPPPGYEAEERSCDGLDNDCDGVVDEAGCAEAAADDVAPGGGCDCAAGAPGAAAPLALAWLVAGVAATLRRRR